jgi:hypothetical protein
VMDAAMAALAAAAAMASVIIKPENLSRMMVSSALSCVVVLLRRDSPDEPNPARIVAFFGIGRKRRYKVLKRSARGSRLAKPT